MTKPIQDAYIVAATRSPIGRSHKGYFKNTRPDELLATVLRAALAQAPGLDPAAIEDLICGCAIPEAQQGLNVARIGAVLAGLPTSVGGITVHSGDLVLGDDDGVVVVSQARLADVLARARAKEASEADVMRRLQEGELTLDILGFRKVLTELGVTL